jgi:hypothetical protein
MQLLNILLHYMFGSIFVIFRLVIFMCNVNTKLNIIMCNSEFFNLFKSLADGNKIK